MLADQTQIETITLTPTAVQAIRDILQKRNLPDFALRVFISGGGCSGIQTGLALEGNIREQDLTFIFDGVKVVVDEVSILYLKGSIIDYVDNEQGAGFLVTNPLASCGCSNTSQSGDTSSGCSGCY